MQPITSRELDEAISDALSIVRSNIPIYRVFCQNHSSIGGIYPRCENDQWTCGFWPGELWLSWELSHDPVFLEAGTAMVPSFANRIERKICVDHHDMGFLYTPSCVSAWMMTGNELAKQSAIAAANQLLTRWQPKGQFLQAWGRMDAKDNYRFIIDCLLNLPLLYWASEVTGDDRYGLVARKHTHTCLTYSFRPDHSTYHTYFLDPRTGKGLRGETCQGYRADSSWARGQAWAVYGLALSFRYTHNPELPALFDGALGYFLSRLPEDLVPYWDLIFQSGSEPRDSSSASIVACGLLEMARLVEEKKEAYEEMAEKLMGSLVRSYRVRPGDTANGLVLHGTYSKKSPYNSCTEEGVDECVSWGDYFYLEALTRLKKSDWRSYW
ncbi:MAG: glycoside hydrolase family 88 protein [Sphaerochaetaceae bacterium]|nr:glycoside hydrolase family 88 protein [Spirochaetales bacterium]MDY5498733.1 glycoside hydrolase family 88 protein [Sphaerochaetaceae bacterium]